MKEMSLKEVQGLLRMYRLWAAKKSCEKPTTEWGVPYRVGKAWRRDGTRRYCGRCIPCKAKLALGRKLRTREVREWVSCPV